MPISEILWLQERVDHIGQHGVRPEEFEEVCFGAVLVLRAKATGRPMSAVHSFVWKIR